MVEKLVHVTEKGIHTIRDDDTMKLLPLYLTPKNTCRVVCVCPPVRPTVNT